MDLDAVLQIYNDVVLNTTATFEEQPRPLEEFVSAFREKARLGIPWIVAELNREVVGYGTYGPFRRASGYRMTLNIACMFDQTFAERAWLGNFDETS